MIAVGHILHIATDDRHGDTENLFAFGVNLEETLASSFLILLVALQMSDDGLTLQETLLLLVIEEVEVILIKLRIEKDIDTSFWSADKAEPCAGSLCLTSLGGNCNR